MVIECTTRDASSMHCVYSIKKLPRSIFENNTFREIIRYFTYLLRKKVNSIKRKALHPENIFVLRKGVYESTLLAKKVDISPAAASQARRVI